MVAHRFGCHGFKEYASRSYACDHLRELVTCDLHEVRQQIQGSSRTVSESRDDALASVDTNPVEIGLRSGLRVDSAEILQCLTSWQVSQSKQNIQLISRLEHMSTILSGRSAKSPTDTCSSNLDIHCKQDGSPAATITHAQIVPEVAAFQPSLYVAPLDIPLEEQSIRNSDESASDYTERAMRPRILCDETVHQSPPNSKSTSSIESTPKQADLIGKATHYGFLQAARSRGPSLLEDTVSRIRNVSPKKSKAILTRMVSSWQFEVVSGAFVTLLSVLLGMEVEYKAKELALPSWWHSMEIILLAVLVIEIILRLNNDKCKQNVCWNVFDVVSVILTGIQLWIAPSQGPPGNLSFLRFFRVVKVIRIVRFARIMKNAMPFIKIAITIWHSLPMFWPCALILGMGVFATAIIITDSVATAMLDFKEGLRPVEDFPQEELRKAFGSLGITSITLARSITGGDWALYYNLTLTVDWTVSFVFLLFVACNMLCILNVVFAIFVDGALKTEELYKELLVHDRLQKKAVIVGHLRNAFMEADVDGTGGVTVEEVLDFCEKEEGIALFEALGVPKILAQDMFVLLDKDGSGVVDIDEFVNGCISFVGASSNVDVKIMILQVTDRIMKIQSSLATALEFMDEHEKRIMCTAGEDDIENNSFKSGGSATEHVEGLTHAEGFTHDERMCEPQHTTYPIATLIPQATPCSS